MASTQGTTRFEPFANLAHVDVRTGGYAEAGGNAALSGNGGDTNVNFTTLGLRAEHGFTLGVIDATFRGMRARTFSKSSRDNTSVRIISASNLNAFDNAVSSLSRDLGRRAPRPEHYVAALYIGADDVQPQSLQNELELRHADQVAIADIDSAKQHHVDRLAIRRQLQPSPQFQPGNQDGRVPPRKYQ